MSLREFSPLYQWGLSLRTPKFLVPLLSNNVFIFGKEAIQSSEAYPPVIHGEEKNTSPIIARKKRGNKFKERSSKTSSSPSSSTSLVPNFQILPPPNSSIPSSSTSVCMPFARSNSSPLLCSLDPSAPAQLAHESDETVLAAVLAGEIPAYKLEQMLGDPHRAVLIRRKVLACNLDKEKSTQDIETLPFKDFDYGAIMGRNCENVIGFVQIPVGVAGPLLVNGKSVYLPMATTEGCLVASTQRGCKAISLSGGAVSVIVDDGMTRGPVVRFPGVLEALRLKHWLDVKTNMEALAREFNGTSRFARLKSVKASIAGRNVYLRFKGLTGDAMGMNMLSKAVEQALDLLKKDFPEMQVLALSGNYCTDKKSAAVNWTDSRGKYVVAEAIIKGNLVKEILKTTVDRIVDVNVNKNLVGSAMAGALGGFNAHAANIVTSLFLATGQDPAQNVESSNCITLMEPHGPNKEDLYVSCSMPSLEVGTIGGGTHLPGQAACLGMLGVKGPCEERAGSHAEQLATMICAGVLAGELSLVAALAAGDLTRSHQALNRAKN